MISVPGPAIPKTTTGCNDGDDETILPQTYLPSFTREWRIHEVGLYTRAANTREWLIHEVGLYTRLVYTRGQFISKQMRYNTNLLQDLYPLQLWTGCTFCQW